MSSPAGQSDRILAEARNVLAGQRAGGRRRSIGRGSAQLKLRHLATKLRNIVLAVLAVLFAAGMAGIILDGIGLSGILLTLVSMAVAVMVFARYPRMKLPRRADIDPASTDVRQLVGRTELWLESQRRALPPPAIKLVDHIGLQLDALGLQLEDVDPAHPAAREVRKLVGEHLPDIVDGYRRIPEHLRYEDHAGSTPTAQLLDSLHTISGEIDSVTRQLASGAIDSLAIKTRYLGYKYGEAIEDETK